MDEKNDKELVKQSLFYLPEQILVSWKESRAVFRNTKKTQPDSVILFGMGGSGLGGDAVRAMFGQEILTPFIIVNNYTVPMFVDEKTLCVFSSYSGNTEEVLAAYKEAKRRGSKMCVIAAGGKLAQMAKKDRVPAYIFGTKLNPSGAPRLGVGYSVGATLGVLSAYNLLRLSAASLDPEFKRLFPSHREIKKKIAHFSVLGRVLAKRMFGRVPVIVASSHLEGAAHVFANEINETAKNFSMYSYLPELNHHLMEGLANPKTNKKNLFFLLFESELYHPRVFKRYRLTAEVLKKNGVSNLVLNPSQISRIGEAIDVILLGCFTAYYLASLNKVNPLPNPWVDYFKKKMG
jgi:glucose/mannose-6-phosphate isomerase